MSLKSEIIDLAISCETELSTMEITDAITEAASHMEERHERMEREAEEVEEANQIGCASGRHIDTWAGLI